MEEDGFHFTNLLHQYGATIAGKIRFVERNFSLTNVQVLINPKFSQFRICRRSFPDVLVICNLLLFVCVYFSEFDYDWSWLSDW